MTSAIQPEPINDPREQPIARYELWAIVAITLLGAAVRFAFPSAMAIEHFDEGVYASNLLFPDQDYRYPDRHLYAPSLIPSLIEWSIIAFGDKGIAPMLPSLLFGTLTIPLIWWVGRQWFGPLSGIAAATLLSFSDFHIAFSRSALTDVPLCFWLLLAVYLFERTFRDHSWPTAIAAGVTTGLAWWTKYNGWLPLAISLSGLMAWSLFARRDERHFFRHLALWAVAAATALLVWSPYWLSLPNGYAEVARNHSQYLVGFAGWTDGSTRQRESLEAFNSLLNCGGLVLVVAGGMWRFHFTGGVKSGTDSFSPLIQAIIVSCWVIGGVAIGGMYVTVNRLLLIHSANTLVVGLAIILATLFVLIWNRRKLESESTESRFGDSFLEITFRCSDWLVAAWVVGLTVSIPVYRPYPRLALLWLVGVILLFPGLYALGRQPSSVEPQPPTLKDRLWGGLLVALMAAVACTLFPLPHPPFKDSFAFRCWETRSQFREIARDVTGDALKAAQAANQKPIQNTQAVLYVYAEPGLFFHLPADGLAVQPAGNLNFVDIPATRKLPTFLVTGPHAQRSKAFADEFAKRADQFELIASYPYDASDFVRLDDVSATQLRARREPLEVRLYRVLVPE